MPDRWDGDNFYPSGATEPINMAQKGLDSTAGADVIKKEPVKSGPIGAKGKPKTRQPKSKTPAAKK